MSNWSKDYQQGKVYRWENEHIHRHDKQILTLEEAQDWIDFIWANLGRQYPPIISINKRYKAKSTGSRLKLEFIANMLTRSIIIHELTHSLYNDGTYNSEILQTDDDGHGPMFVGSYVNLLVRFMKFPLPLMYYTLHEANIDVDLGKTLVKLI